MVINLRSFRARFHLVMFAGVLGLFCLGQLGRISFFEQKVNIYLYEAALIVGLIGLVINYGSMPINFFRKYFVYFYLFFAYTSFTFLAYALSYPLGDNIIAFSYQLRLLAYFFYALYFSYFVSLSQQTARYTRLLLLVTGLSILGISWVQYLLYPDLRNVANAGWDPHLYRIVGAFLEPPIAGTIYGIFFLVIVDYTLRKHSLSGYLGILLATAAILLTYARSIYIALIITICVYVVRKFSVWQFLLILCVFLGLMYAIPKQFGEGVNLLRTSTIQSRLTDYQKGFAIFYTHPFIGIGYNRIRLIKEPEMMSYSGERLYSHAGSAFQSSFLVVAVTGGIIGLLGLISALYYLAAKNSLRTCLLIFVCITSLFDNVLLHPFIFLTMMLLCSLDIIRLFDRSP